MFLAKSGAQSTSYVAKRLKMERVQAYRTFKKLQEKAFIEATLERPTRFTVVPFEKLLDSFIESKKTEVTGLVNQKTSLLSAWNAVSAPETDYTVAKFSIISGKKKIHAKMLSMIEEAEKEVRILTTGLGVIQEDLGGVFDAVLHTSPRRGVQFRIIADISKENLKIMERLNKRVSSEKTNIESRHLGLSAHFFPRFLIKDEAEAILYASSGEENSVLSIEDEGLWINDKMFISILKAFFTQMWQTSVDAASRIEELKTGIPMGETTVIKDPVQAWKKIEELLEAAKEDVVLITSSQSLNGILDKDPLASYHKEGVKYRLMAPIDLDNLDAAKTLSSQYEIKHVPISYMTMMLIDNKNLFMFKSPPMSELNEDPLYVADAFYTNDSKSIEPISEMLNDTWKRGMDLTEITQQAGMKLPTVCVSIDETLAVVANTLLENSATSVLIAKKGEPVGLINDRELLKEAVASGKSPDKILVKDLNYTPLLTLSTEESMTDALKTMREKGAKRIAVIKGGQLMGMLTQPPQKEK